MNFLLLVLFVSDAGVQPVYADRFETFDVCEAKKTELVRQVSRQQRVDYVAFCAPIRNGTQVDA